jgi:DNA polymerase III, delta subunit
MIQTYLFLTQTSLELGKIQKNLAKNFFDNNKIEIILDKTDENLWGKYRNSGQIILFEPTDLGTESKKETFKKFLQNDVWVSYVNPTLLFLGDLSQYSDSLQEGMLKLLEEPPANLMIILFAQNLSRIKPTIISRSRIQSIPTQIIFQNLNTKIVEKVKKLPEPSSVVKNLLGNIKVEIEKASDYEREEIDMWLWQVETNLGMIYNEKSENKIAESVTKVLKARQLNDQNLQKKFSIGWLNT